MSDWRRLCSSEHDLAIDGDVVLVTLSDSRQHKVKVAEVVDRYELSGIVARRGAVDSIPDVPLRVWRRNRATQLVGFRIDSRGRVVGEAWVSKAGLRAEEFLLYLRRLAAECDLFEYHLTGEDRE